MPILSTIAAASVRAYGYTSRMRKLVTVTLTSSQTWVAPLNVTSVDVTGKGGGGQPSRGFSNVVGGYNTYTQTTYRYTDGHQETSGESYSGWSQGSKPSNYCDSTTVTGVPGLESFATCYRYESESRELGNYTPPANGSASSALGKTFPGGAGGAATPATYTGVAVTPGSSYPVVIGAAGNNGGTPAAAGGSVTISYYQ